ncbi:hypothetical protein C7475_10361 [Chitinophaga sp. S165]|nr:hypothetical protein C7475_10361 [Chitinophaga sp. S165]
MIIAAFLFIKGLNEEILHQTADTAIYLVEHIYIF